LLWAWKCQNSKRPAKAVFDRAHRRGCQTYATKGSRHADQPLGDGQGHLVGELLRERGCYALVHEGSPRERQLLIHLERCGLCVHDCGDHRSADGRIAARKRKRWVHLVGCPRQIRGRPQAKQLCFSHPNALCVGRNACLFPVFQEASETRCFCLEGHRSGALCTEIFCLPSQMCGFLFEGGEACAFFFSCCTAFAFLLQSRGALCFSCCAAFALLRLSRGGSFVSPLLIYHHSARA
jgi:hypothetical protein